MHRFVDLPSACSQTSRNLLEELLTEGMAITAGAETVQKIVHEIGEDINLLEALTSSVRGVAIDTSLKERLLTTALEHKTELQRVKRLLSGCGWSDDDEENVRGRRIKQDLERGEAVLQAMLAGDRGADETSQPGARLRKERR